LSCRRKYLMPQLAVTVGCGIAAAAPAAAQIGGNSQATAAGVQTGAAPTPTPEAETVITVKAERSDNLVGRADSASQGTVGSKQLAALPLLRPGEILETVPGLIVTQHSGSGKANQYFLRGFNLDHGTDIAISVDGIPYNLPSNAHGQGYSDLNPLIPELVAGIKYRKGSYEADQGDFSSAGSVDITYKDRLPEGFSSTTIGSFGYDRELVADSPELAHGSLIYGLELMRNDGPWTNPDKYNRYNGLLRYTATHGDSTFRLIGMGYDGHWNSTDQAPQSDFDRIGRFGSEDPSDGGLSSRYNLATQWDRMHGRTSDNAIAYAVDYRLTLWSNFSYFLNNPIQGDQLEQTEHRQYYGFKEAHTISGQLAGRPTENILGLQARSDDIGSIGLFNTEDRVILDPIKQDRVRETSAAPYFENRTKWARRFRTVTGMRYDDYYMDVHDLSADRTSAVDNAIAAANSGSVHQGLLSPKFSAIFGPFGKTEFYSSIARGFHSNDARGVTQTEVPPNGPADNGTPGGPTTPATPLVRSDMAEIGVRTTLVKHLQSTLSLFTLKLDSELTFDGDEAADQAGPPSRRTGVEFANYYTPGHGWTIDADYTFTHARLLSDTTDFGYTGDYIQNAIPTVFNGGIAYDSPRGLSAALRLRYFSRQPVTDDGSIQGPSSTLVYAQIGKQLNPKTRLALDVFNLFNAKVDDIAYDYTYQVAPNAAPQTGLVVHPAEPREVRLSLVRLF